MYGKREITCPIKNVKCDQIVLVPLSKGEKKVVQGLPKFLETFRKHFNDNDHYLNGTGPVYDKYKKHNKLYQGQTLNLGCPGRNLLQRQIYFHYLPFILSNCQNDKKNKLKYSCSVLVTF